MRELSRIIYHCRSNRADSLDRRLDGVLYVAVGEHIDADRANNVTRRLPDPSWPAEDRKLLTSSERDSLSATGTQKPF